MRHEPCICGGTISAPDDPVAILAAVADHNRTQAHRQARARRRHVEAVRDYRRRLRREVELARARRWRA